MDADSWLCCFLFLICIVFSGYFSCAESCFVSANKLRIRTMAEDGNKRAENALYVMSHFDEALTTILIGTNVMHIAAASVAAVVLTRLWQTPNVALYSTLISTGFLFLAAEVIPKSFAADRANSLALSLAGSLRLLMRVLAPVVRFFSKISSFVTNFFKTEEKPTITEAELYDIIDTAEEEGVVDEEQSDLIKSALDFSGATVGDVMTPLDEVTGIELHTPPDEVARLIRDTHHSRLPVYSGDKSRIVGVLQIRRFLRAHLKGERATVRGAMTPITYIGRDDPIDERLSTMSQKGAYLAAVAENGGKTAVGIVTIEDFLEELVGEIWDEDDVVDDRIAKLGGGRYRVRATVSLGEVFEEMDYPLPAGMVPKRTVGAWVLARLGRNLKPEDTFLFEELEITVDEMNGERPSYVIIHWLDEAETEVAK